MRVPAAFSNLGEFGYWIGVPMLAAFSAGGASGVLQAVRSRGAGGIAAGTVLATWVVTAFAGTTYTEVARLWIFFVPAMVLAATRAVERWARGAHAWRGWAVLLVVQLLWTVALKNWQDF